MKMQKSKTATIAAAIISLLMLASMTLMPLLKGDGTISMLPGIAPPYEIPTYLYLNVAPNPIGVGQQVNINAFFGASIINSETPSWQKPENYNATITAPNGHTQTVTLTADQTGGGYYT